MGMVGVAPVGVSDGVSRRVGCGRLCWRRVGWRRVDFAAGASAELLAGDEVLEPAAVVAGEDPASGLVDEGWRDALQMGQGVGWLGELGVHGWVPGDVGRWWGWILVGGVGGLVTRIRAWWEMVMVSPLAASCGCELRAFWRRVILCWALVLGRLMRPACGRSW